MHFRTDYGRIYEEVLHRPRPSIDPKKVDFALERIREACQFVAPTNAVTAARDPEDNIFLDAPKPLTRTIW